MDTGKKDDAKGNVKETSGNVPAKPTDATAPAAAAPKDAAAPAADTGKKS